ncbi:MAG: hypothetical protein HYW49_09045 [Deltaproteobacteria bacterium]|nr:hypothetical protein [Deltaproteobacteria bacterium]
MLRLTMFARIVGILLFCLIGAVLSQALDANASSLNAPSARSRCERAFGIEKLTSDARKQLERGETVMAVESKTDSPFHMIYGMRLMRADAELAMAVISAFGEQKNHISAIIESSVEAMQGNFTRVNYEIYVDHPLVPNSRFTSNVFTNKDSDGGYLQYWNLANSEGISRLAFADGYARTVPSGSGALLVFCSYNVPALEVYVDVSNKLSSRSLEKSITEMGEWAESVARDSKAGEAYLRAFRRMIGVSRD